MKGLDIVDIYKIWASEPEIRGRMRDGSIFNAPQTELNCDQACCVLNKVIRVPVVALMRLNNEKASGCGLLENEDEFLLCCHQEG